MNRIRVFPLLLTLILSPLLLTACGSRQRLRVRSGKTAVRTDQLSAGEIKQYLLDADEGQILAVTIVSPDPSVHLALHGHEHEIALVHAASNTRRWAGRLPSSQDYVIHALGGRHDTEYALVVALLPSTEATENLDQVFVGVSHMTAPMANALQELTLVLNADKSAVLTGLYGVESLTPLVMQGTWHTEANAARVKLAEQNGESSESPETFWIAWRNGRFVTGGQDASSWRTAGLQFTPASGDYHVMVGELHGRLAAVGAPGHESFGGQGNVFAESTRCSIVAFQNEQSMAPTGIADAATWAALDIALLPTHAATGSPIVYLTFDDGPDARYTPQILELLEDYGAKATFFVLGEQASFYPDLIRAEAAAGHSIANHGYAHHAFDDMSRGDLYREIQRTEELLREAAGDLFAWQGAIHFVRPPYGLAGEQAQQYASEFGYVMVMWHVDSQDWQQPGVAQIAAHVVNNVQPGDIVLMHDGGGDRTQTIIALELILQELSARGFTFKSIFGD